MNLNNLIPQKDLKKVQEKAYQDYLERQRLKEETVIPAPSFEIKPSIFTKLKNKFKNLFKKKMKEDKMLKQAIIEQQEEFEKNAKEIEEKQKQNEQ